MRQFHTCSITLCLVVFIDRVNLVRVREPGRQDVEDGGQGNQAKQTQVIVVLNQPINQSVNQLAISQSVNQSIS